VKWVVDPNTDRELELSGEIDEALTFGHGQCRSCSGRIRDKQEDRPGLLVAASKRDAKGINDKGKTTRADLSLQQGHGEGTHMFVWIAFFFLMLLTFAWLSSFWGLKRQWGVRGFEVARVRRVAAGGAIVSFIALGLFSHSRK
jgi:hypothetical protein